jgi:hypothetical protein
MWMGGQTLQEVCKIKPEIYCDGLGNTPEMNVAAQWSGTDLVSPTKRLFRIRGARER